MNVILWRIDTNLKKKRSVLHSSDFDKTSYWKSKFSFMNRNELPKFDNEKTKVRILEQCLTCVLNTYSTFNFLLSKELYKELLNFCSSHRKF